ncbi:MAG TPA: hypothetical protein VGJ60_25220 [Chloroflexota bacterium]|jgi:hypothetical protein
MATTVTARQLPSRLVLQISSVAIAAIALALVAVALSARQPDTSNPGPSDVIDRFLSARQMGDLDTAITLFQSDAQFIDSAGNTSRGMDAATRLIERYSGFEVGPRQVTGNEVVWTEALPIRTPDNLQFQQQLRPELSAEVPYYAFVQAMCAVVTSGRIHAVVALPEDRAFGPDRHCDGTSI